MSKSGINPQFLNVEKKVPYNLRLPKRLIDKVNGYAELSGNTATNIIHNVLDDFLSDKVVLNDYLDNVGGVTIKIPFAIYQKNRFKIDDNSGMLTVKDTNLLNYNNTSKYKYYYDKEILTEKLEAELFEVKKIPNNLDININGSYSANKKILLFNQNAIHSGIELFVYNIAEVLFADTKLDVHFDDKFDYTHNSFDNALYCLYFEVAPDNSITVHLIDYLTAINLLSTSGNDKYKDLIIACATELKDLDEISFNYYNELNERKANLSYPDEEDYLMNFDHDVEKIEKEVENKYLNMFKSAISDVADKYNSNNIIPFGSDIFSRLAVKDVEVAPDINELIDKKVNEKFDEIFDKIIGELENTTADIHASDLKK